MEWTKVKSVAKTVVLPGEKLNRQVLNTMRTISDAVGATLGPGGRPVLIERQEYGMPGMVTKDGVTVFRSLGFKDPVAHSVMESARDSAVRTVTEAGDGTTTATILSYALVRHSQDYLRKNPHISPQRLVQDIQECFEEVIAPLVDQLALKVEFDSEEGQTILHNVAAVSANGDIKLADAVMEAFSLVGDNGTVTIVESSGPTCYKVERIHGFPIQMGFEESCQKFMTAFINDGASNRVFLKNPQFVLFNGTCTDVQSMVGLLEKLQYCWLNRPGTPQHDPSRPSITSPNVVIVANGFSESVLGTLALNMPEAGTVNVVPLVTPRSAILNGEVHFLEDLSAITGASVLNSLSRPLDSFELADLGKVEVVGSDGEVGPGEFEMFRFRSTIVGRNDEDEVSERAEAVEAMIASAPSEYDSRLMRERLACLTGGIAKLTVVGSSNGELRERKDRADDAVQAVKGAIRHGALPAGGWTLMRIASYLHETETNPSIIEVLVPALQEPVRKLFENTGSKDPARKWYHRLCRSQAPADSTTGRMNRLLQLASGTSSVFAEILSLPSYREVNAVEAGLLDSVPAVLEAIRNSVSAASLLGTLGGIVVFDRDEQLERDEASANEDFVRNAGVNPANERW
jgi:chaperonin GroEL